MTLQTGRGWMPDVDQNISPNIKKGRDGHAIKAAVMHIMDGGYTGSIDWLTNPASGVSAHFAVSKAGKITQLVNLFDTAYANGLAWSRTRQCWIDPEGTVVDPPWPLLTPPTNPNLTTVSVEHEGRRGAVWTPEMYEADRRILLYIQSQQQLTFMPHTTLIGHNEISPSARPYCPGTGCDLAKIAASVTAAPDWAGRWGTAYSYFAGSGIAAAWRDTYRTGTGLGVATTDEFEVEGFRVRGFWRGYITWSPTAGTKVERW